MESVERRSDGGSTRKRWLGSAVPIAVLLTAILAAAALAHPQVVRVGNLILRHDGGIIPNSLPRHEQAPVSAFVSAALSTTDGSHLPAAKRVVVDLDRSIHFNAAGLPVCKPAQLEARTTAAAKSACRDAIVGGGKAEVEVAFPEQAPFSASGPLVLFNGGVHGKTTLLYIHAYVAVPAPTALVATVKLSPMHHGQLGTHTVTTVPMIAGGAGSATKFRLTIGRRFTQPGGRKASYLTASCPTGHYSFEGEVLFADGTSLGLHNILPCIPKG